MLLKKKLGFTLVELMVVIVIIGILAALAIPRLTGASDKAKMSEAPGVIKSFESAYLAYMAETGKLPTKIEDDLVFEKPESRWFNYTPPTNKQITATTRSAIGKFAQGKALLSDYIEAPTTGATDGTNCFVRSFTKDAETVGKRLLPNYIDDDSDCGK